MRLGVHVAGVRPCTKLGFQLLHGCFVDVHHDHAIHRQRDREPALQRVAQPPGEARVQGGLREQCRQQQAACRRGQHANEGAVQRSLHEVLQRTGMKGNSSVIPRRATASGATRGGMRSPAVPWQLRPMRRLATLVAVLLLAAALMPLPRAVAAQTGLEDLLARAAALSAAAQHREAYALLAAEEDEHIGEIPFDYALGRAALNAGLPDRATLAFSRVLALDPGHVGARIDSGRAFLALGNHAQARAVFEALLELDPPPALRSQLLVYLGQAGDARGRGLALRGYLGIAAGHSNNVNQAPAAGQVFVPGLLATLQLSDQNVRKADSYASVFGGIEGALPLQGRASLIGSAEFVQRSNRHESDFNVGGILGGLGMAWSGERYLLRAQAQAARSTLGGEASRDVNAVSLDAIDTGAGGRADFAFLLAGTSRYATPDLQVFDANFVTFGAGAMFRIAETSTISVAILADTDRDRGGNPSGNRDAYGFRATGETADRFQAQTGRSSRRAAVQLRRIRPVVPRRAQRRSRGLRGLPAVRRRAQAPAAAWRNAVGAELEHSYLRVSAHRLVARAAAGLPLDRSRSVTRLQQLAFEGAIAPVGPALAV